MNCNGKPNYGVQQLQIAIEKQYHGMLQLVSCFTLQYKILVANSPNAANYNSKPILCCAVARQMLNYHRKSIFCCAATCQVPPGKHKKAPRPLPPPPIQGRVFEGRICFLFEDVPEIYGNSRSGSQPGGRAGDGTGNIS